MKKYTTINNQSFSQAFLKNNNNLTKNNNNNNNHLAEPTYDMPFNDCKIEGTVLLVQHNIIYNRAQKSPHSLAKKSGKFYEHKTLQFKSLQLPLRSIPLL